MGEARWTRAGNLPCKIVIQAAGPNFNPKAAFVQKVAADGDQLLYKAYAASMKIACEHQCRTVCFSLLSAGFFRGPRSLRDMFSVACRALRDGAYPGLECAHLLALGTPHAPATADARALQQAAVHIGLRPVSAPSGDGLLARAAQLQRPSPAGSSIVDYFGQSSSVAPSGSSGSSSGDGSGESGASGRLTVEQQQRIAERREAALLLRQQLAARETAPSRAINLISDGDATEEDEVAEVPAPAAKKARAI